MPNKKTLNEENLKKIKSSKDKYIRKQGKILNKYLSVLPNNTARFIKIPRTFLQNHLGTQYNGVGYNGDGWVLNFLGNDTLVFRKYVNPRSNIMESVNVNSNSFGIKFVDTELNEVSGAVLDELIYLYDHTDFSDDNWNDASTPDPFLYIDKNLLYSLYPGGNQLYFSQSQITYADSALEYPEWNYNALKIECKREGSVSYPSGPHPVQAKFMLALPCPPEWNPAFSGGTPH